MISDFNKLYMIKIVSSVLVALFACYTANAVTYKTDKNIAYRSAAVSVDGYVDSMCRIDVYYPEGAKDFPTLVWFHGGSLRGGKREIPKELMQCGFAIVAVDYRLTPKVKTPECIDDAAAATAWVFDNIERFGGSRSKIYLSGHSAGGYLVLMIGYDKKYLAKYGVDANRIAGIISYSGQAITHFTNRAERGIENTQAIIDEYAPIYHVRADAPPTVLITGDREMEMLGRYEENAYMWRMLQLVGHKDNVLYELDGFNHGGMKKPAHGITIRYFKEKENL